jgi:hypothetical protein
MDLLVADVFCNFRGSLPQHVSVFPCLRQLRVLFLQHLEHLIVVVRPARKCWRLKVRKDRHVRLYTVPWKPLGKQLRKLKWLLLCRKLVELSYYAIPEVMLNLRNVVVGKVLVTFRR